MPWTQPLVSGLNHGAFGCPMEEGLAPIPRPRDCPERFMPVPDGPRKGLFFELCQLQLFR